MRILYIYCVVIKYLVAYQTLSYRGILSGRLQSTLDTLQQEEKQEDVINSNFDFQNSVLLMSM